MAGVRIEQIAAATPDKDSVIVFDGESGTHKVPLGDLAALVGTVRGIAGFHNSIFRGANLKERFGITDDQAIADEVSRRIADGFDDLFVGDYWPVTITTEFGTETVEIVLAGFDVYMKSIYKYYPDEDDYYLIDEHHAVCVTRKEFNTKHRMNSSNLGVPSNGYIDTEMNTVTLPKYATALNTALNGHIIEICDTYAYDKDDTIPNANDPTMEGAMTSWDYGTDFHTHLTLLTERELYGAPAYSSGPCEVGFETSQLPLFRLDPTAKYTGYWCWLKDYAGGSYFCDVNNDGLAYYGNLSYSGGVRPRFLIV